MEDSSSGAFRGYAQQKTSSWGESDNFSDKWDDGRRPNETIRSLLIPPPLPLLPQKQNIGDPLISTGLNMYFKKVEPFS